LLKAAVFRQLGYATVNANWRGLYLTAANVLEKKLDLERIVQARRAQRQAGDDWQFPMMFRLQLLATRLMAEKAGTAAMTLELRVADRNESYGLTLRNAILEFHSGAPGHADITVSGTAAEIARLIDGIQSVDDILPSLKVTGNREDARRFMSYFEKK